MRKISLAKPRLLSNLVFLIFILITSLLYAEEITVKTPDQVTPEQLEDIKGAVAGFQKPMPETEDKRIIDGGKEASMSSMKEVVEKYSLQSRYPDAKWDTGSDLTKASADIYYFFSFSMPDSAIEAVINEANEKGAVMVLVGLVNDTMQDTAKKLLEIHKKQDMPVIIDPTLFTNFAVDRVPAIIKKEGDKIWRVNGVSLKYALDKFVQGEPQDFGTLGSTYPIMEKNMLDLIYERIRNTDWESKMAGIKSEIKTKLLNYDAYNLPTVTEDKQYLIDPTVVLSQDIKDQDGNVLFPAGSVFNPLDIMPFTGQYIFIDGNDPAQVNMALAGEYTMVIMTRGNFQKLMKENKRTFYIANAVLVKKFKIAAVPSIIMQDGRYIKVVQKALN